MLRWGILLGTGSDREDRRGSALGDLVIALIAPLVAVIIQLAISRSREYAADSSGSVLFRRPRGACGGLGADRSGRPCAGRIRSRAPPRAPVHRQPVHWEALARLFSTHPPVEERVARLRALAARLHCGGASLDTPSW